jgi:hypothetical protein
VKPRDVATRKRADPIDAGVSSKGWAVAADLGRRVLLGYVLMRRVLLGHVLLGLSASACGYRALYAGDQGTDAFAVVGIAPLVADASVVAEVEAGVRAGLARAALLRGGQGYPRIVVEVLRLDAATEAVQAVPGGVRTEGTSGTASS